MKRPRNGIMRLVGIIYLMVFGSALISIGGAYIGLSLAGTWGGIIGGFAPFFAGLVFYKKWIVPDRRDEYEEY